MRIKVWGVRGSCPVSGSQFSRYGCATTCIEVCLDSGHVILLDAGTGLVNWAKIRASHLESPPMIFFSHYHLDHILGLPFYAGIYDRQALPEIYCPCLADGMADASALGRLFDGVLFPVIWQELPAQHLHPFRPGESFRIGGALLQTVPTCHAGGCTAFKICGDGWTFAYSGDHEIPLRDATSENNCINSQLMEFLAGADIALVDSHFTPADHRLRPDWGHSDFGQWADALTGKNVGRVLLSHYSPEYDDSRIESLLAEAVPGFAESSIQVSAAREGCVIDINSSEPED